MSTLHIIKSELGLKLATAFEETTGTLDCDPYVDLGLDDVWEAAGASMCRSVWGGFWHVFQ